MEDISKIQCRMVGISLLGASAGRRARAEWDDRFREHEAFWVDAHPGQTAMDLAKSISQDMAREGIKTMGGTTLVLSVFLDLMQAPDMELLEEVLSVSRLLNKALGCLIPLTLEFGYVGQFAFGDSAALKKNIWGIVEKNRGNPGERKQLCLVGISPLWDENEDVSWKAVMTCLDLLRRQGTPGDSVPVDGVDPSNNVGFLRYGEYDEAQLQALIKEKSDIEYALSDHGAMELRNQLAIAMGAIERETEKNYPVDGNSQPVHLGMYVEGFFARKRAQRGGEPFASARNSTLNAIDQTGKELKKRILDSYRKQTEDAETWLRHYLKEAGVGIELERDRKQMEDILSPAPLGTVEPPLPGLAYKESGYTSEIDSYLKGIRRYAGAKARHQFATALLKAYQNIPDKEFARRSSDLLQRLDGVKNRLNRLMTLETLTDIVAQGNELPGAAFQVTLAAGRSSYWVVSRNEKLSEMVEKKIAGAMTVGYHIDAVHGGLKTLDNAPLKAIQFLQFQCSEELLNDLIG